MRIRIIINEREMMIHPHIGIKTIQKRENEIDDEEKETKTKLFFGHFK